MLTVMAVGRELDIVVEPRWFRRAHVISGKAESSAEKKNYKIETIPNAK